MAKRIQANQESEQKEPEYNAGEKVLFVPQNGQEKQTVEVVGQKEGTSKIECKFEDGTIAPVNRCYLQKK